MPEVNKAMTVYNLFCPVNNKKQTNACVAFNSIYIFNYMYVVVY